MIRPSVTSSAGSLNAAPAALPEAARKRALAAYTKLPLAFAPNAGQAHPNVRYLAQGAGFGFSFTKSKVVMALEASRPLTLELRFMGASPDARLLAREAGPGRVNYLAAEPTMPAEGHAPYQELIYRDLWPGIDLVFRGERGKLKYEFHVAAGASVSDIRLAYAGAKGLSVGSSGSLRIETPAGVLNDAAPVSHQRTGARRRTVESRYELSTRANERGYGFALGPDYDPRRPLVIDPGIAYSTFLGAANTDDSTAIAVDRRGNAYITGSTFSGDFPTSGGAYDVTYNGSSDVFVTKLNASGTALIYSTFIGGPDFDFPQELVVDQEGRTYITGLTDSPNFPTTPSAYDRTYNGARDAFVAKLSRSGGALLYSTFLGGPNLDAGLGIDVDRRGVAYVSGLTDSVNFPTTQGAYDTTHNGAGDAFVTKLSRSGKSLVGSTFLGGTGYEEGRAVAVDQRGRAHVAGSTFSVNFPTSQSAYDPTPNGGGDLFVTRLNASGTALAYSTYLGGTGQEHDFGIALDRQRHVYVTGFTRSGDFPTTAGAYDSTLGGGFDGFVTKVNTAGTGLAYSTFLGGTGADQGDGVALDRRGRAYVAGRTYSTDFPTTPGAYDTTFNGVADPFVTKLNSSGTALAHSSYLGGSLLEQVYGIAIDRRGAAYVTGFTLSADFPTSPGAYDTTFSGADDTFVTKIKAHHKKHR